MAYDTDNKKASIFPSSQIRQNIVLDEIKNRIKKDAKILDMGCADGNLVIELIKNGYTNVKGIDNSPKMIEEAKHQLKKDGYTDENIFSVADIDNSDFFENETFDVVIVMGLIEYAQDLNHFFNLIYILLEEEGIAFIESKNKLFNLFSANEYTINSDIRDLVEELDNVKHLSHSNLEKTLFNMYSTISNNLAKIKERELKKKIKYKTYPFKLPQYSPGQLIFHLEEEGLITKNIIYYHCHPFPPRYRKDFPELYDELSILMQPLGYTSLGALICSAFVMEVKK